MNLKVLVYATACVAGLVYVVLTSSWMGDFRNRRAQERNHLIFTDSKSSIEIPIQSMAEFDGASRDEVLHHRLDAISTLRSNPVLAALIPGDYAPISSCFGQIESGAPWWGIHGIFFFGPGQRSISGPSEESRFLLNPLLLVGVVENRAFITKESPDDSTSYYPRLRALSIVPATRTIQAGYEVGGYLDHLRRIGQYVDEKPQFSLSAYNARDFGYNFVAIDTTRSRGARTLNAATVVASNLHFIHRGGSCGYPGGCNNMSPHQAEIEFSALDLPATVVVKLWKAAPFSPEHDADATVVLELS